MLAIFIVSAGSVSAMFYGQSSEIRATRMVDLAEDASQRVGDLIDLVSSNATALGMIETAGLTEEFEGNLTLYAEGTQNVTNAESCLAAEDYGGAIANATEALSIFREVYRSIHVILYNSGVKIGTFVDVDALEEAIERSLGRVEELKALISTEAPIYSSLIEAEGLLTEAKEELLPDNIEDAKANLREANILISEVCQYLKQVAQELNPQRIRDYCEKAYQYRYRFRERFREAGTEGFDVDGFLQSYGYQNEDDFMARFREMIENAEKTEDIEDVLDDLEEIGRLIREMDQNITQEMSRHRAQYGQSESTGSGFGGFGQESGGSGYSQEGGGSGFGQEADSGGYGKGGGSGYGANHGTNGAQSYGGSYGQDGSSGSSQTGFGGGQ